MYNRISPYYDRLMKWFFPIGEIGRERIVEKLSAGAVLDVACGTGTLLAMAAQKGLKCYGMDLSIGMFAQAKRKVPDARFQQGNYYQMPFATEIFDQVVATNALSGESIEVGKVLCEMLRVCRLGGRILIAEWPKAEYESSMEHLLVWLAKFNDDAPKDYVGIFRGMGYEPEIEVLDKRYHIYVIRK
jgi:ubiquinone/menaquinone biosynthesis C-methylase UbiE